MPSIAGYDLDDDVVRETALATSYRAHKDGKTFFFKVYAYRADGDVTAQRHQALQERIRVVLDGMGNVSETIVAHGVVPGHCAADPEAHDDAYFQAKPWVASASGDKVPDLADHIAEERRVVAPMSEDPVRTAELEERLAAWVFLARMVASHVRRCHESDLVHQDLKPEQFLAVPIAGGVRPVIADFDWSFFGAEGPLKRVSTLRYSSPEQVTRGLVGRPTDVFTLAIIVFEILTGGVWPLATKAEMEAFLTSADIEAMSLRGGAQRTLREVYQEYFRTESLDFRGIDRLDAVLAASLEPNPAHRPTAGEIERTLAEMWAGQRSYTE